MQSTENAIRLPGLAGAKRLEAAARAARALLGLAVVLAAALPAPREVLLGQLARWTERWDEQTANVTPGPIQARNGDLILVPFGAPTLDVKSPCGGVAEIYYGKEPTPRFSETFGRNQPVSFVFKAQ